MLLKVLLMLFLIRSRLFSTLRVSNLTLTKRNKNLKKLYNNLRLSQLDLIAVETNELTQFELFKDQIDKLNQINSKNEWDEEMV